MDGAKVTGAGAVRRSDRIVTVEFISNLKSDHFAANSGRADAFGNLVYVERLVQPV